MKKQSISTLKNFLDRKVALYNTDEFIVNDPVSIPHRFSVKEDIEISGFLTAIISWGQRPVILSNAKRMMQLMHEEPFHFVLNGNKKDFAHAADFVHRTFNGTDFIYFLKALRNIYKNHGGLEAVFEMKLRTGGNMDEAISHTREVFLSHAVPGRSSKHFSDPLANSAAKRINMFLRWMVRKDKAGVDFGIWKNISPALLYCPLDVHSGHIARELGLLLRKQNDWKAVEELTANLRKMDARDPVKYDFALFGIGVTR